MKNLMNWFVGEESGQGMVEYGLILVLVALAAIITMGLLGGKLSGLFQKITETLKY